jgi:hypothetical protein
MNRVADAAAITNAPRKNLREQEIMEFLLTIEIPVQIARTKPGSSISPPADLPACARGIDDRSL